VDYVPTLFVNEQRYTGDLDPAAVVAALDSAAIAAGAPSTAG
jgi:hypothetical protein